jgi:DNA-binding LytR/AlgR family response regulator
VGIMIHVAVCDDETVINQEIQKKTLSFMMNEMHLKCKVSSFNRPTDLIDTVKKSHFDLVEMDIELNPNTNGIAVAQEINRISPDTKIIFVTAYHKYYLDVYDARHAFFVEKDKMDEMLPRAIKNALNQRNDEEKNNSISLKSKGEWNVINKRNILYIEKRLRIAEFNIANAPAIQMYLNNDEIKNMLNSEDFVQIHRSFVVNLRHVIKMNGASITMSDGRSLPIGRMYMKNFQESFIKSHQNRN